MFRFPFLSAVAISDQDFRTGFVLFFEINCVAGLYLSCFCLGLVRFGLQNTFCDGAVADIFSCCGERL